MSRASKVTNTAGLGSRFRSWSDQSADPTIKETPSEPLVALSGELLPSAGLDPVLLGGSHVYYAREQYLFRRRIEFRWF
jgi:hypothetical protein